MEMQHGQMARAGGTADQPPLRSHQNNIASRTTKGGEDTQLWIDPWSNQENDRWGDQQPWANSTGGPPYQPQRMTPKDDIKR
ncbi:MAG TPA: hypothetical protein V6C88_10595 [Chroococcidiopsis sp.]